MNDLDLALEMFQRAVAINCNVQTLNNLAYLYQIEYEDHQRAVELLEQVIKMNPNSEFPYGLLGEAYLDLEFYQKAEEALRKAVSFRQNPSLLNNLGVALYKQQQRHMDDYAQDIEEYKDLFQKVMEGHRPSIDFNPRVMGNCYMFGCIRHGRLEYV